MKTTIYELLGMIKDGKAPKKIKVTETIYEYDEESKFYFYHSKDYSVALGGKEDEINLLYNAFNENVEILETTITYNQYEPIFKKIDGEWYVRKDFKPNDNIIFVEKEKQDDYIQYQPYTGEVEIKCNSAKNLWESDKTYKPDKIEKLSYQQIGSWALEQHNWVDYARAVDKQIQQIGSKINEIIDRVNAND